MDRAADGVRTVLWTGSRGWSDVDTIIECVTSLQRPFRSIVGDARGWDALVWEVLAEFSLPRWRFDAQWRQYGKRAGHVRNALMADVLRRVDPEGFVVAGWDGQSTGTKGMIDLAERRGISVWKVMYIPSLNEG